MTRYDWAKVLHEMTGLMYSTACMTPAPDEPLRVGGKLLVIEFTPIHKTKVTSELNAGWATLRLEVTYTSLYGKTFTCDWDGDTPASQQPN